MVYKINHFDKSHNINHSGPDLLYILLNAPLPRSEYFPYAKTQAQIGNAAVFIYIGPDYNYEVKEKFATRYPHSFFFQDLEQLQEIGFSEESEMTMRFNAMPVLVMFGGVTHKFVDDDFDISVATLLHEIQHHSDLYVLGLPVVDEDLRYLWQPRKLRYDIQKQTTLKYLNYPTGYEKFVGKLCFQADGGMSGLRLFRSVAIFKELFKGVYLRRHPNPAIAFDAIESEEMRAKEVKAQAANDLVLLDIAIQERSVPQHICFSRPAYENHYLNHADLTIAQRSYFSESNEQFACGNFASVLSEFFGSDEGLRMGEEDISDILEIKSDEYSELVIQNTSKHSEFALPYQRFHYANNKGSDKPFVSFFCYKSAMEKLLSVFENSGESGFESQVLIQKIEDSDSESQDAPNSSDLTDFSETALWNAERIMVQYFCPEKSNISSKNHRLSSLCENIEQGIKQSMLLELGANVHIWVTVYGASGRCNLKNACQSFPNDACVREYDDLGETGTEQGARSYFCQKNVDKLFNSKVTVRHSVSRESIENRAKLAKTHDNDIKIHFIGCSDPRSPDTAFYKPEVGLELLQDRKEVMLLNGGTNEECIKLIAAYISQNPDVTHFGVFAPNLLHGTLSEEWKSEVKKSILETEDQETNPSPENHNVPNTKQHAYFFPIEKEDGSYLHTCRALRVKYWKAQYYEKDSAGTMNRVRFNENLNSIIKFDNMNAHSRCFTGAAMRIYSKELALKMKQQFVLYLGRHDVMKNELPNMFETDEDYEMDGREVAITSPSHYKKHDSMENSLTFLVTLDLMLETILKMQSNLRAEVSQLAEDNDVKTHYLTELPVPEAEWYLEPAKIINPSEDQDATENKLPKGRLSKVAADVFQVEAIKNDDHFHIRCMRGLNWFQISSRGVVGSYCFRRVIDRHVKFLLDYWVNIRGYQAMPEEGTLLSIFRNGETSGFPWDSDFDLKFYTEEDMDRKLFKKELEEHINSTALMPTQAWNFDGCGADHYFLIRIPNITHHVGDVYFNHKKPRSQNPWKLKLFDFPEMSISQHHLEHIYFDRYHGPTEKRFGDSGTVLQCWSEWHNACLPNCSGEQGEICEFDDNFVHIDNWELPETEVAFWPRKRRPGVEGYM